MVEIPRNQTKLNLGAKLKKTDIALFPFYEQLKTIYFDFTSRDSFWLAIVSSLCWNIHPHHPNFGSSHAFSFASQTRPVLMQNEFPSITSRATFPYGRISIRLTAILTFLIFTIAHNHSLSFLFFFIYLSLLSILSLIYCCVRALYRQRKVRLVVSSLFKPNDEWFNFKLTTENWIASERTNNSSQTSNWSPPSPPPTHTQDVSSFVSI